MQTIRYSVVAPMHNEQGNLRALYSGIKTVMDGVEGSYEIIFVNDASTDGTLAEMKAIHKLDPRFHFSDLETNVGENWALLAGISKAAGEIIVTIDGDDQNDPRYIPELLRELDKGYRVVSGCRQNRAAGFWIKRLPSQIANAMIRMVSGVPVHDCGCGLKAYRREVLEGRFVPRGFMNRFAPVCLGIRDHEFAEVEIVDRPRLAGESHYGLSRVFVVLRDLWALPFALRGSAVWLSRFRFLFAVFVTGAILFALLGHRLFSVIAALCACACLSNIASLKRFVAAGVNPNFRIRQYR